eukprot:2614350-Pleurochrysis_carterae.AAC.1
MLIVWIVVASARGICKAANNLEVVQIRGQRAGISQCRALQSSKARNQSRHGPAAQNEESRFSRSACLVAVGHYTIYVPTLEHAKKALCMLREDA